jgi:hypothetical protein
MTVKTLTRPRIGHPLALAAALALWAGAALVPSAVAQAPLGGPAPDFTRTGNDGVSYTLSDGFGDTVQLLHMIGFA